jgi:cytochrome P450
LFYLLSQHPEVEERLLDEVESVAPGRPLTAEDADRMPFTEQVISETLRLYPPVYATIREADRDHDVAGFHIPAGTRLVVNIRGLHRDPGAWPDPERFDPDRFAGGADDRHRFQFIPFLGGPKKCLGDHFAMLEMRLTVPTLLRSLRFRYAGPPHPKPVAGFTLSTDGGMWMEVRPRTSSGGH